MKKFIPYLMTACLLVPTGYLFAQEDGQNSGTLLQEALKNIENQFGVHLNYEDSLLNDRRIEDIGWLKEGTVERSLIHVLAPNRLMFVREEDKDYRITTFETGRRSVEEGRAQLKFLAHRYNNQASWEERKNILRSCMLGVLKLSALSSKPDYEPLVTPKRVMNGYTVENIAIETLPGLFVAGSLYRPLKVKGKIPVILSPNGHFDGGRYRTDQQYRMATLARMGAMALSYDMFGWGESQLQFDSGYHRTPLAMSIQALNGIRLLDFLTGLEEADPERVGITGGSGGGSQTMMLTALDDRIDVSVPVVMLSSYFNGGCPCETGRPVHQCGGGTSNVEIAAMAAPRPQLVISDGNDWTDHVPEIAYPYLQTVYDYYGKKALVKNVHLPEEGHDYGYSKRIAMYEFMARHLGLDIETVRDEQGDIDESATVLEEESALYVFDRSGEHLPKHAIRDLETLQKVFEEAVGD